MGAEWWTVVGIILGAVAGFLAGFGCGCIYRDHQAFMARLRRLEDSPDLVGVVGPDGGIYRKQEVADGR